MMFHLAMQRSNTMHYSTITSCIKRLSLDIISEVNQKLIILYNKTIEKNIFTKLAIWTIISCWIGMGITF
jgi:hypothetical protein